MKVVNTFLSLLFFLFAIVQYNDPDPWLWIALYSYIALISGMAALDIRHKWMIRIGLAVCVIWNLFLLPDFLNWLQTGAESIVEEMKAEKPHIELTREFLGLAICIVTLCFHWKNSK